MYQCQYTRQGRSVEWGNRLLIETLRLKLLSHKFYTWTLSNKSIHRFYSINSYQNFVPIILHLYSHIFYIPGLGISISFMSSLLLPSLSSSSPRQTLYGKICQTPPSFFSSALYFILTGPKVLQQMQTNHDRNYVR